jgi:iron complex outermembrane recepter protein
MIAYPAFGQDDAPPAEEAAPADEEGFAEIVVSAQKREQTLQEVPVSVAVVDDEALRERRIVDVQGLAEAVPNLAVSASPFQPYVVIRGLGSTYVDGVYAGRANQFLNPFFDVERVEVVRGPQGVLFGVNANAGAINIVTKKGDGPLEGYATAGYEFENGGYNAEAGVTVPLTDDLGMRLAGRIGRDGGYIRNLTTGNDIPEIDSLIGRATLSWRPDGPFRADLSYEYSDNEMDGRAFQNTHIVPGVYGAAEDGAVDFEMTTPAAAPVADFTEIASHNASLNAAYEIGDHVLSSTSGYSTFRFAQAGTPPGTVYIGTVFAEEDFEQFYQEVRLASPTGGLFEYILGASYLWQDDNIPQGLDVSLAFFGAPFTSAIRSDFRQKTNTYAAFAQGTVNITSDLSLSAGLRYSSVKKDVTYFLTAVDFGDPIGGPHRFNPMSAVLNRNFGWMLYTNPANPATIAPLSIARSRTFEAWNPSLTLNWELTNDLSTYASFTTGTKAGGFNDQEKTGRVRELGFSPDPFEFDAEKARNYEIGFKFAGRRARLNVSAFYVEYTNMQVSQALGTGVVTTNAASANAKGLEADGEFLLMPDFSISGDFAYIDAKYDDFPGAGCIPSVTPTGCVPALTNAAGGRLTGVPEVTASVGANYSTLVGSDLELKLRGRVHYNDGAQWNANQDPKTVSPSYWSLDAGITLGQVEEGWSVSLTGKNLTNEVIQGYVLPHLIPVLGYQVIVEPGRQIFLDVGYRL